MRELDVDYYRYELPFAIYNLLSCEGANAYDGAAKEPLDGLALQFRSTK